LKEDNKMSNGIKIYATRQDLKNIDVSGSIPKKLSQLENDLYYPDKEEVFLSLTKDDFTVIDGDNAPPFPVYIHPQKQDWFNSYDAFDFEISYRTVDGNEGTFTKQMIEESDGYEFGAIEAPDGNLYYVYQSNMVYMFNGVNPITEEFGTDTFGIIIYGPMEMFESLNFTMTKIEAGKKIPYGTLDIQQPDWDEKDEKASGFIKNKPFGVLSTKRETVYEITDLYLGGNWIDLDDDMGDILEIGSTYRVTFGSDVYDDLVCFQDGYHPAIGVRNDDVGYDTKYPFNILYDADMREILIDTTDQYEFTNIDIKIEKLVPKDVKKLDPMFFSNIADYAVNVPNEIGFIKNRPFHDMTREPTPEIIIETEGVEWGYVKVADSIHFDFTQITHINLDSNGYTLEHLPVSVVYDGGVANLVSYTDEWYDRWWGVYFATQEEADSWWYQYESDDNPFGPGLYLYTDIDQGELDTVTFSFEFGELKQIEEKFIPNIADYSVNDPEEVGFIKNRPFYDTMTREPIPETTVKSNVIDWGIVKVSDPVDFDITEVTHITRKSPFDGIEGVDVPVTVEYDEWHAYDFVSYTDEYDGVTWGIYLATQEDADYWYEWDPSNGENPFTPGLYMFVSEETPNGTEIEFTYGFKFGELKKIDPKFLPEQETRFDQIIMVDELNGFEYIVRMRGGRLISLCKNMTDIQITQMPTKTAYVENDTFDLTGLKVYSVYEDGTLRPISDYEVTGYPETISLDNTNIELTVTYTNPDDGQVYTVTCNYEITITSFIESLLIDFEYTDNGDGTYTITDWKQTLNGVPSTEVVVPDNENIILDLVENGTDNGID
jgi:hypothetical protein